MLGGAPDKLTGPFSQVELTGFAHGHFSVIYDRANGDFRLNVMVTTLPTVPDEGQLCSVRSRSPSLGVLTVCAIKPTFGSATSSGASGSYARYS